MSAALVNHIQKQIAVTQNILYDLQIDLQEAESGALDDDMMDIPFSEIWAATHPRPLKADAPPFYLPLKAAAAPFYPVQPEGTKLKWVSDTDDETYRVAIAKKDGILEVKLVTNGSGYCHDTATCACNTCGMIRLSGGKVPPWLKGAPLIKTFFKDEAAWRASLPAGGTVTITPPQLSERALKALCMEPLTATTDALKLKELEMRFPGATMVLSTDKMLLEIEYMGDKNQHRIYSNTTCEIRKEFSDFGLSTIGKPNLMAEWRGMYIGLEHLF